MAIYFGAKAASVSPVRNKFLLSPGSRRRSFDDKSAVSTSIERVNFHQRPHLDSKGSQFSSRDSSSNRAVQNFQDDLSKTDTIGIVKKFQALLSRLKERKDYHKDEILIAQDEAAVAKEQADEAFEALGLERAARVKERDQLDAQIENLTIRTKASENKLIQRRRGTPLVSSRLKSTS